jgi:predicted methyltransferase
LGKPGGTPSHTPPQNLAAVPPATSCRAGAVVHLLRANGVRVPVTLHMTQHDDGERVQHVVKVQPSSEGERLNLQRLVLSVGESGTVLAVNEGASKVLFGFAPQVGCCRGTP